MATTKKKVPFVPKQEIYTYDAPWTCYALAWANNETEPYRLAVGSFVEEYSNKVQIVELDQRTNRLVQIAEFDHPYPTTKIMWHPSKNSSPGIIATTGDYLRIWNLEDSSADASTNSTTATSGSSSSSSSKKVNLKVVLNNSKNVEYCAPLTAMDWNRKDTNIIGMCSIDTTCTIWDINQMKPTTQLIAHDKEVFDIAFQRASKHIFASVGADGSVRMFDLRSLEHSTIVYESKKQPLLRLRWNMNDDNYIATMMMNSPEVVILDIRVSSRPVATLPGHDGCVNAISWAPHSSCHICTAGDDKQALIWDLARSKAQQEEPILAYHAPAEINNLSWSASHQDWVAIAYEKSIQILRV